MQLKIIILFYLMISCHGAESQNKLDELPENEIVYKKWNELDKKVKSFVNYVMKMAMPTVIRATSEMNLTSTCMKQGFEFTMGLRNLREWAIEFIDSSGKGIDGLLAGTIGAFGNYDGCLNAVATKSNSNGGKEVLFRGQYCILEIKPVLPITDKVYSFNNRIEGLVAATQNGSEFIKKMASLAHTFYAGSAYFGICVPSGCNEEDVEKFTKYFLDSFAMNSTVTHCEMRQTKYNTPFIVSVFFYSLAAFLVIIGTALHFYANSKKIKFQSKTMQALLAFSFVTNFGKVFNMKVSDKSLAFLNGLRFLSIGWLVLAHAYMVAVLTLPFQRNFYYVYDIFDKYFPHLMQQVLSNSTISVATFLFIGGLLNCYLRVKELEVTKSQSNIFQYIALRLWRTYPVYIYSILLTLLLYPLGDGPIYTAVGDEYMKACYTKWWRNLIFINNFYPLGESCMGHFWYMATDMQLYLVSLITIPVLLKRPKYGVLLNLLVVLMSVVFTGVYTWYWNLTPSFVVTHISREEFQEFWRVHAHPVINASPYFLGVLGGYFLATKKAIKIPKIWQCVGWSLSTVLCSCAVFGTKKWNAGLEPTEFERIMFPSLAKTTFTVGIAWIVLCCATGHGGVVNYILSWPIWIPLARLSFLIYLTSLIIQFMFLGSFRNVSDISNIIIVWRFIGDLFASAVMAFIVTMLVEVPFLNLQKLVFSKVRKNIQNSATANGNCKDNEHEMKVPDQAKNGTLDIENTALSVKV
ncbi:nose resistant to fluoxetine protein 6-like [Stegodyphus dumicola]|uniref:nose resistant to fluoxetine protein 6-like n=1 Tax=Stegodyphus dumicola TaxID=202533 RepID=UPI0015AAD788|nr:nose resistant to fluoxetine protein 6-like [Stegodyphus dumicola]